MDAADDDARADLGTIGEPDNNGEDDNSSDKNADENGYDTGGEEDSDGPEFEPSEDQLNGVPFHWLCQQLEMIWASRKNSNSNRKGGNPLLRQQGNKLRLLVPPRMKESLRQKNGSAFPLFRLIVPESDTSRQFSMKDNKTAEMYCKAFGWEKGSKNQIMLSKFTDPQTVPQHLAGDLSLVAEHILAQRMPSNQYSNITIGEMNGYLDELASFRGVSFRAHHNHRFREDLRSQSQHSGYQESQAGSNGGGAKKKTGVDKRVDWLRKLMARKLSPLEHKWLIRMILGNKMDVGIGVVTLLEHYSKYAKDLWNAHNNLKKVCTILADPAFLARREEMEELRRRQEQGRASLWEPQVHPAELGNKLLPMVSTRTFFDRLMTRTQETHAIYLKKYFHPPAESKHKPLSLQFPALSAEIKLDGERMIVHVKEGRVTMNTRRGKWYSELYSPVLGPSLRKSLAKYPNVNLILDGEIEAWDNSKQELIPFGENRTVAQYRRAYLKQHKLLDPLDLHLHDGETDPDIQRVADDNRYKKAAVSTEEEVNRGERMWLKAMFFDVLFVGGPDAKELLDDCGLTDVPPGSIIHLPLLNRKQVLHQLLSEQENEVEICPSIIVRPNGEAESPRGYYSVTDPMMEFGHVASVLDSTHATIAGEIPNLEELDEQRMKGNKLSRISMMRAREMDRFYKQVVEDYKFEGLVVKDLASPYLFAIRKFWWKFKPDYEHDGGARDIDVLILGCTFASGMRLGGSPSSFLVGVVDSADSSSYLTLCNVNAASVSYEKRDVIWQYTGFKRGNAEEKTELGKWYREKDWSLPSFISKRSMQRNQGREDYNGWTFDKAKTYPDLWVNPEDSVVLTIKGAELVISDEHSAGVTVRFPRITKVRLDGADGDEKMEGDVEGDVALWASYVQAQNQDNRKTLVPQSQSYSQLFDGDSREEAPHRFLTPEELKRENTKKRVKKAVQPARGVPKVEETISNALDGLTFIVLEGNYKLKAKGFDVKEGQQQGWLEEASKVRNEADVITFLKMHGGTFRTEPLGEKNEYLIGGEAGDAKVDTSIEGMRKIKTSGDLKGKNAKEAKAKYQHINGILKWTFIYTLVSRWRELDHGMDGDVDDESDSLLSRQDPILVPCPYHYLAKVNDGLSLEAEIFNLDRPLSTIEMERAMDSSACVSEEVQSIPWQYRAMQELPEEERCIMSTNETKLWPYRLGGDGTMDTTNLPDKPVVMYPDVFQNGFGLTSERETIRSVMAGKKSERWQKLMSDPCACDELLSVLLLARGMGALETPHLHTGVTHVLCHLRGLDELYFPVDFDRKLPSAVFQNEHRGNLLLERLETTIPKNRIVKLVSPSWVINKWEQS